MPKKYKNGIAELNVPSFDPLKIDKVDKVVFGEPPIDVEIDVNNVVVTGLADLKVEKISGFEKNFDGKPVTIKFKLPKVRGSASFHVEGTALFFPFKQDGSGEAAFENGVLDTTFTAKSVKKDGKEYLQASGVKVTFEPTK